MPPPGRKRQSTALKKRKKLAAKRKGRHGEDGDDDVDQELLEGMVEGDENEAPKTVEASAPLPSPRFPIDQLLDKAEECMDRFEYDVARRFCDRALQMDRDHLRALEVTSGLLVEIGDTSTAKVHLNRAIQLQPESGHRKYMSLAQILTGYETLNCYRKGLEVMQKDGVTEGVAAVHCAIAELFMTDLCDASEAEQECHRNLKEAVEKEPENPEAHQVMAQFFLVKQEFETASSCMDKSLSIWLSTHQTMREMTQPSDPSQNGSDSIGAASLPPNPSEYTCPLSYQTRVSTSQILIELERWDEATEVLEGLLEEDSSSVEPWYLLGWANKLRGEDYQGNARYYLSKALRVNKKTPSDDPMLVAHCKEILEEMGEGDCFNSDEEEKEEGGEAWNEEDFNVESSGDEEEPMQE